MNKQPIQSRIKLTTPPVYPAPWRAERVVGTIMVWVIAADGSPVCAVPSMEAALIIAAAPTMTDILREIDTVLSEHPDVERGNSKVHYVSRIARGAVPKVTPGVTCAR